LHAEQGNLSGDVASSEVLQRRTIGGFMKLAHAIVLSAIFSVPAVGIAQDSLVGKYNATYSSEGINARPISVTIVISSVEGNVVKGTGIRGDKSCRGEYPLEGTLKDNQIRLRATTKGGPGGDCSFGFTGTVEGNSLAGRYGNRELQFSK
jgi:hypothetical protein